MIIMHAAFTDFPFPLPLDQVRALIVEGTAESLDGARAHRFHVVPRAEFDGAGHDIAYDLFVVWERPDQWGTHAGTIRQDGDADPRLVLFSGHYDIESESEAMADFATRRHRWHGLTLRTEYIGDGLTVSVPREVSPC